MKKHLLWLIELFIWLFVIILLIFCINFYHAKKVNQKNTYHIFTNDVNGLMKGAPIKIMGVQVGYVTEINVIEDYVYVSFLITKPNVTIPHGSAATIESYGIAGSKSIELYPPKDKADETQAVIFVKEPYRASLSYKIQGSIARNIIAVSEGTISMLDSKTLEQHKRNIQKLAELSGKDNLNVINEKSDEMIDKIRSHKKNNIEVTNDDD